MLLSISDILIDILIILLIKISTPANSAHLAENQEILYKTLDGSQDYVIENKYMALPTFWLQI